MITLRDFKGEIILRDFKGEISELYYKIVYDYKKSLLLMKKLKCFYGIVPITIN
jgi:hypothetical protein